MWYLKSLNMYTILKSLGPKLLMIKKMVYIIENIPFLIFNRSHFGKLNFLS
jgi:hypothetical protein